MTVRSRCLWLRQGETPQGDTTLFATPPGEVWMLQDFSVSALGVSIPCEIAVVRPGIGRVALFGTPNMPADVLQERLGRRVVLEGGDLVVVYQGAPGVPVTRTAGWGARLGVRT